MPDAPHSVPGREPAPRLAEQAYLAGNNCVGWTNWVASSLIGIALANFIPISWGLGFAGILALLVITCSMAVSRLRLVAALVAGVVAVLAYGLPLKLNILVAIVAAVAVCLLLQKPPQPAPPGDQA